jgi:hypothetical protein
MSTVNQMLAGISSASKYLSKAHIKDTPSCFILIMVRLIHITWK